MDEGLIIPLAGMAMIMSLGWPIIRAVVRRIERQGSASIDASDLQEIRDELRELNERLELLEQGDPRVTELEERLDFAERVLAQQDRPKLENPNISEVPT